MSYESESSHFHKIKSKSRVGIFIYLKVIFKVKSNYNADKLQAVQVLKIFEILFVFDVFYQVDIMVSLLPHCYPLFPHPPPILLVYFAPGFTSFITYTQDSMHVYKIWEPQMKT